MISVDFVIVFAIESHLLGAGALAATRCLHLFGAEGVALAHGGDETDLLLLGSHLLLLEARDARLVFLLLLGVAYLPDRVGAANVYLLVLQVQIILLSHNATPTIS